jgi:hypothetical protein
MFALPCGCGAYGQEFRLAASRACDGTFPIGARRRFPARRRSIGMAPALAQEPPATTPAPETEQAPAAKTDTATETKKPEPAAYPHTVHHTQVGRYVWPWDWA